MAKSESRRGVHALAILRNEARAVPSLFLPRHCSAEGGASARRRANQTTSRTSGTRYITLHYITLKHIAMYYLATDNQRANQRARARLYATNQRSPGWSRSELRASDDVCRARSPPLLNHSAKRRSRSARGTARSRRSASRRASSGFGTARSRAARAPGSRRRSTLAIASSSGTGTPAPHDTGTSAPHGTSRAPQRGKRRQRVAS